MAKEWCAIAVPAPTATAAARIGTRQILLTAATIIVETILSQRDGPNDKSSKLAGQSMSSSIKVLSRMRDDDGFPFVHAQCGVLEARRGKVVHVRTETQSARLGDGLPDHF